MNIKKWFLFNLIFIGIFLVNATIYSLNKNIQSKNDIENAIKFEIERVSFHKEYLKLFLKIKNDEEINGKFCPKELYKNIKKSEINYSNDLKTTIEKYYRIYSYKKENQNIHNIYNNNENEYFYNIFLADFNNSLALLKFLKIKLYELKPEELNEYINLTLLNEKNSNLSYYFSTNSLPNDLLHIINIIVNNKKINKIDFYEKIDLNYLIKYKEFKNLLLINLSIAYFSATIIISFVYFFKDIFTKVMYF